ncbi:uncharacterized protein LOC130996652 [Salvia miltiorrhiza]|uniref:uncharacterized protein LOC130996652 n=1 Tax=Salvia miltiorrhiza TaxID=226208 RepID=UPI0025ACC203|nr:uncharacterized protein LOC130996652 [Salvia miltiorrhiza]
MPQVDLETLVTACAGGGNDRKIACETLADDDPSQNDEVLEAPPESFWLSKDAEYDWFERNAFYERKDSTKGNSNSTQHVNPTSTSANSQRFSVSLKSKASIIGLPKTQKTAFVDSKRRACKPPNIRLFPKRSESSAGKTTAPVPEPGSPKVSCMGRVRSKRGRRRSNSLKRHEKPPEKPKTGLYSKVMSLFRSKKGQKKASRSGSRRVMEILMEDVEPPRKSVSVKVREVPVGGEAPGLGGITRFASGRRSGSWVAEELELNPADSTELDRHADARRC